jgi:hypothetical protein
VVRGGVVLRRPYHEQVPRLRYVAVSLHPRPPE